MERQKRTEWDVLQMGRMFEADDEDDDVDDDDTDKDDDGVDPDEDGGENSW